MDCPKCRTTASDDATSCPSCEAPLTWRVLMPNGQTFGPYSTEQVREYVGEGRIPPTANLVQEATGVQMALHHAGFVAVEAAAPPVGAPGLPDTPRARHGWTAWIIAAVIIGAGVVVVAILAAVMLPVFARAREKARQTSCLSSIKQLGMACMMYSADWDEQFPTATDSLGFEQQVFPYVRNQGLFTCPSAPNEQGYEWNPNLAGMSTKDIGNPANVPALWDAGAQLADVTPPPGVTSGRHNRGDNVEYADGHAAWSSNTLGLWAAIPVPEEDEEEAEEPAEGG